MADVLRPVTAFRVSFGALCALKTIDLLPRLDAVAPLWVAVLVTGLWLGASLAVAAGKATRSACLLLAAMVAGLLLHSMTLFNQHMALIAYLATFLALLDERLAGVAIRLQLTVVYAFAAAAKANPWFLQGEVLQETTAWMPDALLIPAAVGTVLVEAFLAVALWSRRTRPLGVLVGVGFHVAVIAAMSPWSSLVRMVVFNGLMLAMYLPFCDRWPRASHGSLSEGDPEEVGSERDLSVAPREVPAGPSDFASTP